MILSVDPDVAFSHLNRFSDDSIIVPMIEHEIALIEADYPSIYSAKDMNLPDIFKKMQTEVVLKTKSENFYWLNEPIDYASSMQNITFFDKDLINLVKESKNIFNGLDGCHEELHGRGHIVYGEKKKIGFVQRNLATKALRKYDQIIINALKGDTYSRKKLFDHKERIAQFCSMFLPDENRLQQVGAREIVRKKGKTFDWLVNKYFSGDNERARSDSENLKRRLGI
jgi:hypothetical protein